MANTVTYPLDLSGIAATNLIQGELHSVSEAHYRDYYFIVPELSPFYVDNFSATITVGGVTTPLHEDVDFSFALSYVNGTRVTGKAMYGGITLHNLSLNGILSINYQTVGGDQVADRLIVLTCLADKAYNPRTTIYDILSGVPNAFPPVPHYQDYDDFYGQNEVVNKLGEIRDAILENSSLTQAQISQFLETLNSVNLASYIKRTGDTMSGPLVLMGNPTTDLQAATKRYVDQTKVGTGELASALSLYHDSTYVDAELAKKVNLAGDSMDGPLLLKNDPVQPLEATTKAYVDNIKANIDAKIAGIDQALGNLGIDHTTQQYVDDRIAEIMNYINTVANLR